MKKKKDEIKRDSAEIYEEQVEADLYELMKEEKDIY